MGGGGLGQNLIGGLAGKRAAEKAANESKRALNTGTLGSSYTDIENLLLSFDELVAMGRIQPGADAVPGQERGGFLGGLTSAVGYPGARRTAGYEGLEGGQSRFGRGLESYFGGLAASDPAFAAYREEMANNLNFENGLPADVSRGILQGVRGSSSSRGLLDSGTAGLEEVAALMGGRESLRSNRLAQVNQYLEGSTFQGAIQNLFPGINTVYGNELQRAIARSGGQIASGNLGANIYGTAAGSGGGGGGGGGEGVASILG